MCGIMKGRGILALLALATHATAEDGYDECMQTNCPNAMTYPWPGGWGQNADNDLTFLKENDEAAEIVSCVCHYCEWYSEVQDWPAYHRGGCDVGNTDDQGNTGGSSDNDGSGDNDGSDLLGVVGIVVGGIVFLALLAAAVFVYVHKLGSSYNKMPADQMPAVETMAVEMSEICVNKIDSSSVAVFEHPLPRAAD